MSEIPAFFQAHIVEIYFVYGLGIFLAGFALLLEMERVSQLSISRALPFLAAFGIVHGVHEWVEMFLKISETYTHAETPFWAEVLALGLEVISFLFLLEFGTRLLRILEPARRAWLRWVTPITTLAYLGGIFGFQTLVNPTAKEWLLFSDLLARNITGLPGTVFACWAMLAQRRAFLRDKLPQFGRDLVGAALALVWYALVEEIIGPPSPYFLAPYINTDKFLEWVGMPTEVFRVAAVIVFAFFIIRVMRVFEVEYARRLEAANRARFAAQEEATRELSVMFETCRILGSSLDVDQLLDDALLKIVTTLEPIVAGRIYLFDSIRQTLVERASRSGDPDFALNAAQLRCARDGVQRAFESGDITYTPLPDSDFATLAVPLIEKEKTVGVMCLTHQTAFSNYAVVQTLAHQLAIAIENALLYAQVQEKEQLRGKLLARAVAAQEEERRRIARELHDETGQMLTALGVGLGGVEQTITQNPELAQYQVAELKMMTMRAIDNLRQFVSDLRPSVLDDMGLDAALRWFTYQYTERMGMEINFQVSGTRRRLPSQVETVLFRIAQEGVSNIRRHAQASHASVRLEFADSVVTLTIADNGRGFVVDQVLGAHPERRAWGLLGVQERVELVGGKFAIDSAPGRGTKLTVEIPIAAEGGR